MKKNHKDASSTLSKLLTSFRKEGLSVKTLRSIMPNLKRLSSNHQGILLDHAWLVTYPFIRDFLKAPGDYGAEIFIKNCEFFKDELIRRGLSDEEFNLLLEFPRCLLHEKAVESKKAQLAETIRTLFNKGLIKEDYYVPNFDIFFDFLDTNLFSVTQREILSGNANAAKGVSFKRFVLAVLNDTTMPLRAKDSDYANAIYLSPTNFDETWQYGWDDNQNFTFTIYFNTKNLTGKVKVEHGFQNSYITHLAAVSPRMAFQALSKGVLRITGNLHWSKINFIGFRYRPQKKGDFLYKFYQL